MRVAADAQNKRLSDLVSHALIWYTAGELVKEVYPDHTPDAVRFGIWNLGGYRGMRPIFDQYWLPYIRGSGTFEEAARKLVETL